MKDCLYCKDKEFVNIPDELIDEYKKGNVVLFAGSGISTEQKDLMQTSFFDDICYDLGLKSDKTELSFSEVMSEFCSKIDGKKKLLIEIKKRIDYIKSFIELHNQIQYLYSEISKLFLINNIVTTNWDNFFEEECDAQPFVVAEDFAFYDISERKVFKIHGSISNLSSIVATKEEYRKCLNNLNKGPIGAQLKLLLSTKTIVFIGYSLRDEDFKNIYSYLKKVLGGVLPHSYIVKPTNKFNKNYKKFPMTIIEAGGRDFLESFRKRLIFEKISLNTDVIDTYMDSFYFLLNNIHTNLEKFDLKENPYLLFTYYYQDGLMNSISRFLKKKKSGNYYNRIYIEDIIRSYILKKEESIKANDYGDISYIEGYIHGLSLFLFLGILDNDADIYKLDLIKPYYIFLDKELISNKDIFGIRLNFINDEYKKFTKIRKNAYIFANNYVKTLDDNLEPHHEAFLNR